MPKKKCEIKCVKASEKISTNQAKEKLHSSKKHTINKEAESLDGVDSLLFLKDTKERKKLNDIDGRIMLLKSELKSLMDGTNTDNVCDTEGKNIWKINEADRSKEVESNKVPENFKDLKERMINKVKEFKPSSSSTPSKFTEWLDNAINETNSQCQNETVTLCEMINSSSTSEVQVEESASSRFSQNKVEELLYKSFIVQNSVEDLSDMYDTGTSKNVRVKRKIDQEKCSKSEETYNKPHSVKLVQGKIKNFRGFKRGRKKRIISTHNSESDIEIINLDNTVVDNKEPRTDSCFIDLDISNYDWSEPFDLDDDHYKSHSDVQIISESETKDGLASKSGPKTNSLQQMEIETTQQKKDNENGDNKTPQAKKVWECPVCLEQSKGQEIVATQCGHVFCKTCLESHILKVKNNCPTCRADLKNKPVITLFNF